MISAPKPDALDGDGLRRLDPAAYSSSGGVQWLTGTVFGGPPAQAFHDRVHVAGRLLLLAGDLAAYSLARRAGSPLTWTESRQSSRAVQVPAPVVVQVQHKRHPRRPAPAQVRPQRL